MDLVHIEIQRTNDKTFAHRMLQYWYRVAEAVPGR